MLDTSIGTKNFDPDDLEPSRTHALFPIWPLGPNIVCLIVFEISYI